jgi:hypothetical protein
VSEILAAKVITISCGHSGRLKRTSTFQAVRLLLGHTKVESTVRYLGIKAGGALAIAKQVDI